MHPALEDLSRGILINCSASFSDILYSAIPSSIYFLNLVYRILLSSDIASRKKLSSG
jgi:hypothetical protein